MQRNHEADLQNVRGAGLWQSGRLDEAIAAFRAALACDLEHVEATRNLGNALREQGRFEEAIRCFERVLELDRRDGRAHRYLVETRPALDAGHLRTMEALVVDPQLDLENRIELHFALATAYAQRERQVDSFAQLQIANRLKRPSVAYDESGERTLLASLRVMFGADVARVMHGRGNPSPLPVFIIGMPRSGTTLVEQVLAAHPSVRAGGELDALERAFGAFPFIAADPRDPTAFVAELATAVYEMGTRYLESVCLPQETAMRITDKMPSNFRFAVPLHLALPAAKLVHVRRDPVDTCLSCFATNFIDGQRFSYDLAELGHYYRLYEEHMAYVRTLVPPSALLEVCYEDLVADVEQQSRRIVEHCGLPWDDACLEFWRAERPVRTASVVQVRQPIYTSSVGRARAIWSELAPLREALGIA
jgi:hypothetical protein